MTDFDPDAMIHALAPFLGLTVTPEYRAGVVAHLLAARRIAGPLLELALEDDAEPAPVFVP